MMEAWLLVMVMCIRGVDAPCVTSYEAHPSFASCTRALYKWEVDNRGWTVTYPHRHHYREPGGHCRKIR